MSPEGQDHPESQDPQLGIVFSEAELEEVEKNPAGPEEADQLKREVNTLCGANGTPDLRGSRYIHISSEKHGSTIFILQKPFKEHIPHAYAVDNASYLIMYSKEVASPAQPVVKRSWFRKVVTMQVPSTKVIADRLYVDPYTDQVMLQRVVVQPGISHIEATRRASFKEVNDMIDLAYDLLQLKPNN